MSDEHQISSNGELVPQNSQRPLFPHLYYIDPLEHNYEHYAQLIQVHGGHLTRNQDDITAYQLSSGPWEDRQTFLFNFIDHSLRTKSTLPLEDFEFHARLLLKKRSNPSYDDEEGLHAIDVSNSSLSALETGINRLRDKMSKCTTKFTPEADAYILEQVRMRPRFRTSHKFFEDLAKHDMLRGHTGNSVRSRYRAHLEHKLQYVFKTDNYDNLILDEDGQKIPIEVSLAKTMKNKFTAEDDFHLCNNVIRHVSKILNNNAPELENGLLDENKFSVLISFFDDYARRNPQHSSSSWRDRYRKFARPHGLQKYRDEYMRDYNTKEGPKPMKNMTSRKDRDRGQRRDVAKESKENSEKAKLRKSLRISDGDTAAAAVAVLSTINMLGGHHPPLISHLDHHIDPDMGMTSRESATLDEEISEVKNSNIDDVLRSVDAGHDISVIHPTLAGNGSDINIEPINLALRESLSQDPSREYQYMPSNVSLNEILSDEFYQQKPEEIMDRLKACMVSQDHTELDKISKVLQSFGFTERFVSHVFCVTSGSALPMIRFFQRALASLQDDTITNMKDILYVDNEPGIWTPEADQALLNGDLESLRHMKEDDLNQRRYFFGLEE